MYTKIIAALRKVIIADFKSVQKKFIDQGIEEETVKRYLDEFKVLRDKRDLGENKDIDVWGKRPWEEFKEFVDKSKEEKSKTEQKKLQKTEGAELVDENDSWRVYKILNHEASKLYGSGTKWCITQDSPQYWRKYIREGNCFYFLISKFLHKNDPFYKVAVKVNKHGTLQFWDALDRIMTLTYFDGDDDEAKKKNMEYFYDTLPKKYAMEFFDTELPEIEVDIDDLVERIDAYVEQGMEYRNNPIENDLDYALREQDFDFSDVSDTIDENLTKLKEFCGVLGYSRKKYKEYIWDCSSVEYIDGIHRVDNEIASLPLGENQDEIPNELGGEIDSLSEEQRNEVERRTGLSGGYIFFGSSYDRFGLILDEDKLIDVVDELEDAVNIQKQEEKERHNR